MFTANVPYGKAEMKLFCTNREARNLEIPPIKLPVPMMSIIFSTLKYSMDFMLHLKNRKYKAFRKNYNKI